MLGHLIKWSIMGFGLVVACNQIGVQIAALLTAAGVIGLAVGFAAQETLANFIAGIVIFWDKPFAVGDWLTIQQTFAQVQRVFANNAKEWRDWSANISKLSRPRASLDIAEFLLSI